jgi:hypothetical protein
VLKSMTDLWYSRSFSMENLEDPGSHTKFEIAHQPSSRLTRSEVAL